ncbi:MAG: helix-turn-helix domain-containing protein [Actinomycetota bacterium]|nr:helix-turn-helix domain-containing protein [Actinomycetota bacterium]
MADTIDGAIERATGTAEPLMSPDEVAVYLNVPRATLQLWRAKGRGPRAFKVGRHVRYRREDVLRWLERRADPV